MFDLKTYNGERGKRFQKEELEGSSVMMEATEETCKSLVANRDIDY